MYAGVNKRRSFLRGPAGAALLVWAAWFLGAGLMWWQARARTLHPHFLPLLSLVLVQFLAATAAVGLGLWRVVRGPRRLAAFCCVLVAVVPIMLWVAHASYTLACLHRATLPANVANETALVAGAALADADARRRYPRRLSGERVVMIYDQLADPQRDLAAMDRHVAKLEGVLGRRGQGKIHWIRGEVLWLEVGRGFQGISMSRPETPGPDGLSDLDRHEVAHVAINQHLPPGAEPPTVLSEGWAVSQEGLPPGKLLGRAYVQQQEGILCSLREFVGPEWYFRMWGPVYVYGGPLVDYLLREYGADKFFELYTTCRQETFEADWRRVLGVGLDELEQQLWVDLAKRIEPELALAEESLPPLPDVPEAGPNDETISEEFLSEYGQAVETLQDDAYAHVQIRAVEVRRRKGDTDGEDRPPDRKEIEFVRRGDRARLVVREREYVVVWVAAPNGSFRLESGPDANGFSLNWYDSRSDGGEGRILNGLGAQARYLSAPFCLELSPILEMMAEPRFKVRRVVRSEKDGKSLVTVHFATTGLDLEGDLFRKVGWFSVCPDDAWAVHEHESRTELAGGKQVVWKGDVQYGPKHEGIPTLQSVRSRLLGPDGRDVEICTDVESFEFGPVPEEEFELASFGLDPPDETPATKRVDIFTRVLRLTLWSLATVIVTLVLSVGLQLVRRRA